MTYKTVKTVGELLHFLLQFEESMPLYGYNGGDGSNKRIDVWKANLSDDEQKAGIEEHLTISIER